MFIENGYLVLYQVQDDTVYIEYVLDCRKDYSWLIHGKSGNMKNSSVVNCINISYNDCKEFLRENEFENG